MLRKTPPLGTLLTSCARIRVFNYFYNQVDACDIFIAIDSVNARNINAERCDITYFTGFYIQCVVMLVGVGIKNNTLRINCHFFQNAFFHNNLRVL